jgi:inhibitor of cysteine peptidase
MSEIEVRSTGAQIDARSGDRIVVRIPESPTTGYRWIVGDLPGCVELAGDELVPPRSSRPGAGGERLVTLVATHPGSARIVLELAQPWEGKAADRFELLVTVR